MKKSEGNKRKVKEREGNRREESEGNINEYKGISEGRESNKREGSKEREEKRKEEGKGRDNCYFALRRQCSTKLHENHNRQDSTNMA